MKLNPFRRSGAGEQRVSDIGLQGLSGLNNPSVPLYTALANMADGIVVGSAGGAGIAGLPGVTLETSLRTTAVYRSVELLAIIATFPLRVMENRDGKRIEPHDAADELVWGRPNPADYRTPYWHTATAHNALAGNTYIYVVEDRAGRPVEQWLIHPNRMRVGRDPDTWRKVFTIDGDTGNPLMQRYRGTGEIIHIPHLTLNGINGISPVAIARLELQLAQAAASYGANFLANDATPGGLLSSDQELTDDDAKKLSRSWAAQHGGPSKRGRIAVLGKGAKFEKVTVSPAEAQALETRKFEVAEVARLFGVPPHLLADATGSTSWGSGLEEQNRAFVQYTLAHYTARFEQGLADVLPANRYAKFAYEGLLRGATMQRFAAYNIGRNVGLYSANDIAALEDRDGVGPEGDTRLQPLNMSPLGEDAGVTATKIKSFVELIKSGIPDKDAWVTAGLDPVLLEAQGG